MPLLFVYALISLFAPHTASDEGSYVAFAEHLTNGFYSGRGDEVELWFGPGLPLLLAPIVALGVPLELLRLLGAVLLFAAVLVFYWVLRLSTTASIALAGALVLGLYWPTLRLLPTLHSEIPAMFFLACFMLAFTLDVRRPRLPTLVAGAAGLAMLAVTRVVFGWVLVVILFFSLAMLLFRRDRAVGRLALAAALGLALTTPWLAYTYDVTAKPFYWATSGGLSLYWMSSPYAGDLGDWHSPRDVRGDDNLAPHRPFFETLRGMNEVEADETLRSEAFRLIRDHPQEYFKNVSANVSRLWFSTPFSYTPQKLSTTFYILPNAFLLVFLVVSAFIIIRSPLHSAAELPFALILIAGVGLQALLAGYARMLVPLVPLMLWFIAQATFRLRELTDGHHVGTPAPDV